MRSLSLGSRVARTTAEIKPDPFLYGESILVERQTINKQIQCEVLSAMKKNAA